MTKTSAQQYAQAVLDECLDSLPKDYPKILDSFCAVLEKNGDLSKWHEIEKALLVLDDERNSVSRAELWSSRPLSDNELEGLTAQVMADSGRQQVVWKQRIDKKLLGGVIVKYGDRVLDMSYDGNLRRLKTFLSN
ncbi:MAG: F0F1 ATP synthase subunit delta [Candidatus Falkowbacteria bacterium]